MKKKIVRILIGRNNYMGLYSPEASSGWVAVGSLSLPKFTWSPKGRLEQTSGSFLVWTKVSFAYYSCA